MTFALVLAFFFGFLACFAPAQSEKNRKVAKIAPLNWQKLPKIDIPTGKIKVSPSSHESKLYQQILKKMAQGDSDQSVFLCRQFLRQYRVSVLRAQIVNILSRLIGKSLQLYCIGSSLRLPGESLTLLLAGSHITSVQLTLWKMNIVKALSQKIPFSFANDRSMKRLRTWCESFNVKTSHFKREVKLPALSSGCYLVTAREKDLETRLVLMISSIAMIVKRDKRVAPAWVASRTGRPCVHAKLYLFSGSRLLYKGRTRPDGTWAAQIDSTVEPLTFLAMRGNDFAIVESRWFRYHRSDYRCYVYLERTVWLPGQVIRGKIFLRHWDYQRQSYSWRKTPLWLTIQNDRWRPLARLPLKVTSTGTASFAYRLPSGARPGKYTLRVRGWCPGEKIFHVGHVPILEKTPKKNKGLPSRFDLSVGTPEATIVPVNLAVPRRKMPVLFTVESDYLLGYRMEKVWQSRALALPRAAWQTPTFRLTASGFDKGSVLSSESLVSSPARNLLTISIASRKTRDKVVRLEITVTDAKQRPANAELLVVVVPDKLASPLSKCNDIRDYYYLRRKPPTLPTSNSFLYEAPQEREHTELPLDYRRRGHTARLRSNPVKKKDRYWVPPRIDFSCWHPHLVCRQGRATVMVKLPRGKRAWKVKIIAIDARTRVGQSMIIVR